MEKPTQPVIKVYGTRGSSACYNIRDFLHRSDVPFQWIDFASDEHARGEAQLSGRDAQSGDRIIEGITLKNTKTGEEWIAKTGWLFLCLGGVPQTQWAAEAGILCDNGGYILTGPDLLSDHKRPENWVLDRSPVDMETSLPGVFAAGDVRHGSIKRCASAVGEGARTIASVHRYLETG
jgi:thioredoxin reductase